MRNEFKYNSKNRPAFANSSFITRADTSWLDRWIIHFIDIEPRLAIVIRWLECLYNMIFCDVLTTDWAAAADPFSRAEAGSQKVYGFGGRNILIIISFSSATRSKPLSSIKPIIWLYLTSHCLANHLAHPTLDRSPTATRFWMYRRWGYWPARVALWMSFAFRIFNHILLLNDCRNNKNDATIRKGGFRYYD